MRSILLRILIISIGIALLIPAPLTLFSPTLAATAFGIPANTEEARAYLLAIATRDVALGVWLLALVAFKAQPRLLAVSLWSIGIVAVGDAINVGIYNQGNNMAPLIPHIAGILVLGLMGGWLWSRTAANYS